MSRSRNSSTAGSSWYPNVADLRLSSRNSWLAQLAATSAPRIGSKRIRSSVCATARSDRTCSCGVSEFHTDAAKCASSDKRREDPRGKHRDKQDECRKQRGPCRRSPEPGEELI